MVLKHATQFTAVFLGFLLLTNYIFRILFPPALFCKQTICGERNWNVNLHKHLSFLLNVWCTQHLAVALMAHRQDSQEEAFDYLFKLVLIGDAGVGKTCVVQRFMGSAFVERHSSTIGVDFTMRTVVIDGKRVKVRYSWFAYCCHLIEPSPLLLIYWNTLQIIYVCRFYSPTRRRVEAFLSIWE